MSNGHRPHKSAQNLSPGEVIPGSNKPVLHTGTEI
jgi:hypothetical protein